MNDTVTKLMALADEYAAAGYGQGYARVYTNGDVIGTRQALQDELTRLFTPLTDEQLCKIRCGAVTKDGHGLPQSTDQEFVVWHKDRHVAAYARAVEAAHGITGESK